MTRWKLLLLIAAIAPLAACDSGGGASCSLEDGSQLAATTWPKFRADQANTGRAAGVDLTASTGNGRVLFDQRHCSITTTQRCLTPNDCPNGEICVSIGPVSTTPILGPDSIFLASSDGTVYVVDYAGQPVPLTDQIQVQGAITGSPLLGARAEGNGLAFTLFVASSGQLTQFDARDGTATSIAGLSGGVDASPNIWSGKYCSVTTTQPCRLDDVDGTVREGCPGDETCLGTVDGTVFVGTQGGILTGVCPNSVARWIVSFPPTQSAAAIAQDPNNTDVTPIIVAGGNNGLVRAYSIRGRQAWSFTASADVVAALLVDQTTNLAYVADSAGRVFAVNLANGQRNAAFAFTASAGITASPALGRDNADVPTLYVADQGGILYALNRCGRCTVSSDQTCCVNADCPTGESCVTSPPLWTFPADGPISSSPAVSTGGEKDVIVFAADILGVADPTQAPVPIAGRVYAIRDDGDRGTLLWTFDTEHSIGASSASIGANQTVYIGRQGNRLGLPSECPMADKNDDDVQDDCVVNDGGALYAIGP